MGGGGSQVISRGIALVGGRGVLGPERRWGRLGPGTNPCFVQAAVLYMESKNVYYPLT